MCCSFIDCFLDKIRLNHKKNVGPPWKSMTAHWTEYIDPKYFPPQAGLEEYVDLETYRLVKIFRMPLALVVSWANLIVDRQDAKARGELGPDEEVFAWKVYLSDSSRWIEAGKADTEREATKKRRKRTNGAKTNKKQRTDGDGSEEEVDLGLTLPDAPTDMGPSGSRVPAAGPSSDQQPEARKQKGKVMKGSPASISEDWHQQVQYLVELCDDVNYQNVVRWLGTSQVFLIYDL